MQLLNAKILILSQPLLRNYGAFLQNYALQTVLKNMGANPVTIDWYPPKTPTYIFLLSWLKTLLFRIVGKNRPFATVGKAVVRKKNFEDFLQKYIATKKCNQNIPRNITKKFDAIIVGSDQVWRPRYNYHISNMFLDFCKKDKNLKRIAYAASFGVDKWEYTSMQTKLCASLAKKFDAISVREESGVMLCNKYLKVCATWVLDPTLLLTRNDYYKICNNIPCSKEKFLAAYILDKSNLKKTTYEKIAKERNLVLKIFYANECATLTIPEWISMFRDASYVVTDSFHGTVFSIIFGKEFKCIYNESRGAARFESLFHLFNSGKLDEMRERSLNWLKNALEK